MSTPQRPLPLKHLQAAASTQDTGSGSGSGSVSGSISGSVSGSVSGSSIVGPPCPKRQLVPLRRHTKAACETCRKSKVRCSGERPVCSYCRDRGVECVFLADQAETQVQALKRRHDESQQENLVYKELYRLLITVNEAEAFEVLQRLRAGTDVATIVRQIQEGDLLLQLALSPESRFRYQFPYLPSMPTALQDSENVYLESLLYEGTMHGFRQQLPQSSSSNPDLAQGRTYSHVYMKPYHSAELLDDRLASVKASSWTSVTTDDNLFRSILRAFLTLEYCVSPALQKDYFLQDLARGKGQFCSPLLVNSVMAIGSHCHRSNPSRSQIWNPQNIGYRFLVEARRLWELEDLDNVKLTTFQATLLLSLAYNSHGMDKIGEIFLRHAVSMATRLKLFSPDPETKSDRTRRAREYTAWAFYNFQTSAGYYFLRQPWLREPPDIPLPDPEEDPAWYGEFTLVYPPSSSPTPMNWPYTFKAQCELRVIMNELACEAFGDHQPQVVRGLSQKRAVEIQSELGRWYGNLPGPLKPKTAVFPSHLRLHFEYFLMHLTLATTVLEEQSEQESSRNLERTEAPQLSRTGPEAMRHLETVTRLYYMRHSFEACDSFLTYVLALLANISLRALEEKSDGARLSTGRGYPEVLRSTLVLAMKGLHDQGRHLHVSKVLFRLLRDRMSPVEADILARLVIAPAGGVDPEGNETESELAQHTRSRFPVPVVKLNEDLDASLLDNLVEKYQAVSLEGSDSTGSVNSNEELPGDRT